MIEHKRLIDYLPEFLAEYREYRRLFAALQGEISDNDKSILERTENALNDTFVTLASEDGIKHWEDMLGIIPNAEATLEDRRMTIAAKLLQKLPYTYRMLVNTLDNLLGVDKYTIAWLDEYWLDLKIAKPSIFQQGVVNDLLRKMLPANIGYNIGLRYNQHKKFKTWRHQDMHAYTHLQLREDYLDGTDT